MAATHNFLSLLTGAVASQVAENSTSVVVETTYRHHGLAVVFVSCEVAPGDFEGTVRGVVAMGRFGCNCSLPHEAAVMAFLDDLFAQCGRLVRRTDPGPPHGRHTVDRGQDSRRNPCT